MEGKVVIVTGSSAGIGAATALILAAQDARLTIHGRRRDRLADMAKQCQAASPSGHEPCQVIGDIEDEDVRKRLVQATIDTFGRIDGLVNNAGWASVGGWEPTEVEDMQDMLSLHILAPYDLCRLALPQLIENKGRIVMVSSVAGLRGLPERTAYITAKHGMNGLMKALAVETAKQGVRVNSVNPGVISTEIDRNRDTNNDSFRSLKPQNIHPNGRIGEARDVASCIVFLLSPASSMVTGIEMPIDGGVTSAVLWNI